MKAAFLLIVMLGAAYSTPIMLLAHDIDVCFTNLLGMIGAVPSWRCRCPGSCIKYECDSGKKEQCSPAPFSTKIATKCLVPGAHSDNSSTFTPGTSPCNNCPQNSRCSATPGLTSCPIPVPDGKILC